jgi:hypothetical protein
LFHNFEKKETVSEKGRDDSRVLQRYENVNKNYVAKCEMAILPTQLQTTASTFLRNGAAAFGLDL